MNAVRLRICWSSSASTFVGSRRVGGLVGLGCGRMSATFDTSEASEASTSSGAGFGAAGGCAIGGTSEESALPGRSPRAVFWTPLRGVLAVTGYRLPLHDPKLGYDPAILDVPTVASLVPTDRYARIHRQAVDLVFRHEAIQH